MERGERIAERLPLPPTAVWEHELLDEFLFGPRESPVKRAVPRQLDGLLHKEPEPAPTAASKRAALRTARQNLVFDPAALLRYCEGAPGIRSAAFFGSVLRDDFLDTSDVDVLLDCDESVPLDSYEDAFAAILGRDVDVRSTAWLRDHYNPLGRAIIWNSKRTFYERRS